MHRSQYNVRCLKTDSNIQMHKAKMFHKLVVNIELGIKSISSPHLHVQMHLISLWLNQMHVSAFN